MMTTLTVIASHLIAAPAAHAVVDEADISTNWRVDFNQSSDLDGWKIQDHRDYKYDKVYLTPDAVDIRDGKVVITTARHCIAEDGDPLTDDNITEDSCPEGTLTRYTTGRIESPWFKGGTFNIDVAGTIYTPASAGARTAIWLQNDQEYCTKAGVATENYGEIDIVEHYTTPWNIYRSPATVHLGCDTTNHQRVTKDQRLAFVEPALTDQQHVWSADVNYDRIRFLLDGQRLHEDKDQNKHLDDISWKNNKITESVWKGTMDRPWRLILNQKVEKMDWAFPARDSDPFPIRRFEVDFVDLSYPSPEETDPELGSDAVPEYPSVSIPPSTSSDSGNSSGGAVSDVQLLARLFLVVMGALTVFSLPMLYLLKCDFGTLRCDPQR